MSKVTPENLARHFAWIKKKKPDDFMGDVPPCADPTGKPPGSWSKVLVMAERYERREALFHDDADAKEDERTGFWGRTLGNEIDHRLQQFIETCNGPELVEEREAQEPRKRRPSELRPRTPEELRKDCERKRIANAKKRGTWYRERATGQLWIWPPEQRVRRVVARRRFRVAIGALRRGRAAYSESLFSTADALDEDRPAAA